MLVALLMALAGAPAVAADSVCYGRPGKGRLEGGVALPLSGSNYAAYSRLSRLLDRNYVHSRVRRVLLAAYGDLARTNPELRFVYGETGHEKGGPIPPHRTHRNGLSVDFMVPVRDAKGRVATLPAHPGNRWGYDVEFDANARTRDGLSIDFAATATHLRRLHEAAVRERIGIRQVIFDPGYLPRLYATPDGGYLRRHLHFMPKQAWVRHDEHYHVDFVVPCKPL